MLMLTKPPFEANIVGSFRSAAAYELHRFAPVLSQQPREGFRAVASFVSEDERFDRPSSPCSNSIVGNQWRVACEPRPYLGPAPTVIWLTEKEPLAKEQEPFVVDAVKRHAPLSQFAPDDYVGEQSCLRIAERMMS